ALLPAPKPVVISLLEGGDNPWIPDVHSLEAMAGDPSSAGGGITTIKGDLQSSGMAQGQCASVSVGKTRRNVQGGLEQGEHVKKPLGKRARKHLDCSTGQTQSKDSRSKEVCNKKSQNPCDGSEKSCQSYSDPVNQQHIRTGDRHFKCLECDKSYMRSCNLRIHQCVHTS
ncbi:ZN75A protein, partial [Odontophorus gujanensis]|nr:ZN75A protein [Odontophorus gujanensis]